MYKKLRVQKRLGLAALNFYPNLGLNESERRYLIKIILASLVGDIQAELPDFEEYGKALILNRKSSCFVGRTTA